jgi:hypothetical protein
MSLRLGRGCLGSTNEEGRDKNDPMELVPTCHVAILAWMGMVAHQEHDLAKEVPEAGLADKDVWDALAYTGGQWGRTTFLAVGFTKRDRRISDCAKGHGSTLSANAYSERK